MSGLIKSAERVAENASRFVSNLAAIILFLLVVLTCVDVIGRYFLSMPVVGAVELVRICMAGIIFFSLPAMFYRNDHVTVDLIGFFAKGRIGWMISIVMLVISIYVAYRIGGRVFDYAVRALEDGDKTEYLGIPRVITVTFITLSIYTAAVLAFIRLLVVFSNPSKDFSADDEDVK
ncbi:TRAP transporter small permease [Candidatus Puniceispirillum sp.]|uniref:TRAP transporter small permease n=1 Tax=Candidatus Puniceispirillum sp. TaxID=2026719 RepID=UPI003F6A4E8F